MKTVCAWPKRLPVQIEKTCCKNFFLKSCTSHNYTQAHTDTSKKKLPSEDSAAASHRFSWSVLIPAHNIHYRAQAVISHSHSYTCITAFLLERIVPETHTFASL